MMVTMSELVRERRAQKMQRRLSTLKDEYPRRRTKTFWQRFCTVMSCLIPSQVLKWFGMKHKNEREAWREKYALCMVILFACNLLAFLTYGMNMFVCKGSNLIEYGRLSSYKSPCLIANGFLYEIDADHKHFDVLESLRGVNATVLFRKRVSACKNAFGGDVVDFNVLDVGNVRLDDSGLTATGELFFSWADIAKKGFVVVDGVVCDANSNTEPFFDDFVRQYRGSDGTQDAKTWDRDVRECFIESFKVGRVLQKTYGCIFADLVLYVSTVAIFGLIIVRFLLATFYYWHITNKMARLVKAFRKNNSNSRCNSNSRNDSRNNSNARNNAISRNNSISRNNASSNSISNAHGRVTATTNAHGRVNATTERSSANVISARGKFPKNPPSYRMACINLVTCYSEDREGIKGTLDSLCAQDYDSTHRVIVVVADGQIKGSGCEQTTPEILESLIEPAKGWHSVPRDYIALAAGKRRHNRARVVPGTYFYEETRADIVLVLKTGTEDEAQESKAGNRGKRDSQVILMGFFQRLIFDDLLVPLDWELYRALVTLKPHINPISYEAILMLDADTIVHRAALTHMLALLNDDAMVVGMCGETRICNKAASWVTAIQVFEYYISHHLNKAFESVFGGVTCIPGCFGIYRIQEVKTVGSETFSLPLLAHPHILNAYSSTDTRTLHQKNLLLLGEDRYLTTLLLKNFFARKLLFCPTATCQTEVPDKFAVLLSQRRRWINSTIHNYFELAMVDQMCGTFCCSMKFVVIMELMGTLVLPAAIFFTGILIAAAFLVEPAWIPLIMLFGILGLPAILIGLTTFDILQIVWLAIYIVSLPVWNFVLPVYAFWHFDDFSWGETRRIEGADTGHAEAEGEYNLKNCRCLLLEQYLRKHPSVANNEN